LNAFRWSRLEPLQRAESGADRDATAAGILRDLRQALQADELVMPLRQALQRADDAIFDWLAAQRPTPPPPPTDETVSVTRAPESPRLHGSARRARGQDPGPVLSQLRSFLDSHPDEDVIIEWRIAR
jgi:hypothetical protein